MKLFIKIIVLVFFGTFLFSACSKSDVGTNNSNNVGTGGSLARFTIYGNYLYLVDGTSLKAIDISNPNVPLLKSTQDLGWQIETIYPYDGLLFVGSQSNMYILSLTDPANPKMEGVASHVRACDPVVAKDNVAFVTVRSSTNGSSCGGNIDALFIYNIVNINNPQLLKTITLSNPHGLGINNNYLYICDGSAGLKTYDVSEESNPILKSTKREFEFYDVIPYNNLLICMVKGGMAIYNIDVPSQPVFVAKTF